MTVKISSFIREVEPPSDADLLASIRVKRDPLLAASDWTQMSDSPLSAEDKAAWAVYRQALRDITEAKDLSAVVWPDPPA
ncbi:tail fiber assembly protein [Celeribacter halophilus]|uniref:Phage tail assembly chaperone protein n=1 Tax=Celeribacter halophilus TaxID=576117 RepID=A0A1I3VNE9_9RHOB|nr:tail fiber assembly protein [Celeribacter halophilus]PZX09465.1 phage tail assembly chaperone [Celeribacter halophilus]SFJ96690.1 Phage tail assembly chaperone protein [Celeribacter halophilus]